MEPSHPAADATESPERSRRLPIWLVLFLLGWLLYELTSQPGLAAAVTCAKFGWADVQTAYWLRRVDPEWRRGQVCFWFYVAFGLWKIALMALLMMMAIIMVSHAVNRPGQIQAQPNGVSPALIGVLATAGLGFGLCLLTTYLAVGVALRHRVKVWLGTAPHRAREQRYWPPYRGHQNAAPFVTLTTLILTLIIVLAIVGAYLIDRPPMAWGPAQQVAGIVMLILGLGSFPATITVLKFLEQRVYARTPEECWNSEAGVIYHEDVNALDSGI